MNISTLLDRYTPFDATEAKMKDEILQFVHGHKNYMDKTLEVGHITGSAWIIDLEARYALLTHHQRLNRWLQLGGHGEGEEFVKDIALREAIEESGLQSLQLENEEVFSLDVHPIPENKGFPAHTHFDLRFLIVADKNQPIVVSPESKDVKWILLEEISKYNSEPAITRMVEKTIALREKNKRDGRKEG